MAFHPGIMKTGIVTAMGIYGVVMSIIAGFTFGKIKNVNESVEASQVLCMLQRMFFFKNSISFKSKECFRIK